MASVFLGSMESGEWWVAAGGIPDPDDGDIPVGLQPVEDPPASVHDFPDIRIFRRDPPVFRKLGEQFYVADQLTPDAQRSV